MDLLQKSVIAVAVVVFIIFMVFYLASNGVFTQQVTQQQAVAQVQSDLQNSNPSAAINITNVSQSQYAGSWHIVASVVLNATSPCPSYYIYSFDYPKYGFVYRVENTYTSNCTIYGSQGNSTVVIGSASAAITRAYDLDSPTLAAYLESYGYSNMVTSAAYQKSFGYLGRNYSNVWVVVYGSPKTSSTVTSLISQLNGSALSVYSSYG